MRIWSLHPRLLDTAGLTALWRETLLAQAVLAGRTKGYQHHPQLERFRACPDPLGAVTAYLNTVHAEAITRGFRYDASRIDDVVRWGSPLEVTTGQLEHELSHLRAKLERRAPERALLLPDNAPPTHPSFVVVEGPVASWERA